MNITKKSLVEIQKHAEECYPEECCGIIVKEGKAQVVKRAENVHPDDREKYFKIDPLFYKECLEKSDEIVMLYHSHPDGPGWFTPDDIAISEVLNIPIMLIQWPGGQTATFEPRFKGKMPYLQRPFVLGILDCYTLVRDYSLRELDIDLPPLQVPYKWWEQGENLYLDHISKFGNQIDSIKDIKEHDVVLMQLQAPVPEHAAIYVGDNRILHHPIGHLSRKSLYGRHYQSRTHSIWRHKSLC